MLRFTYGNLRDINHRFSRSLFGRPHIKRYHLADVAFFGSSRHPVRRQISARHNQKDFVQEKTVSLEKSNRLTKITLLF